MYGRAMPSRTEDDPRQGERIAKLLARAGVASRREIERMIAEGRIARDGALIDTPATVLTSLHGVTVDGQPVAAPPPARLFVYHKPSGLLVTERDPAGRPTIYDRLPRDLPRTVPVGRLDLATEGLLLLTTDGGLKRQLELPATGVERTYRARTYGDITQARLEELIDGIEIDGIRYGSIDANMERRTGANGWIELTLTEGKNREVRRVLEHLGLQVSRLIRTRYGPFILADLQPGEVGEVRQVDLVTFRRHLEAKRPRVEERVAVLPREIAPAPAPAPEPARAPRPSRPTPERAAAKPKASWGTRARPSRPDKREDASAGSGRQPRESRGRSGAREEGSGHPGRRPGEGRGRSEDRSAALTKADHHPGEGRGRAEERTSARHASIRHPGEGRGPAAARPEQARDARVRGAGGASTHAMLDPGLRRGGPKGQSRSGPRDGNTPRPPRPTGKPSGKPPRRPR
jgi:23S rRNA pseudouridine2605 synthase